MLALLRKLIEFFFGKRNNDPSPNPNPNPNPGTTDPPPPNPGLPFPLRAKQIDGISIEPGFDYTIQSEDAMEDSFVVKFETVAERYGMHRTSLRAFNEAQDTYKVGEVLYVPSFDELCFMEYHRMEDDLDKVIENYRNMPNEPNRILLNAARYRGAGDMGLSYGTISTTFYSANSGLDGASERRSEMIKGQREYRVNWGENLWKCNVFMHDCVYYAGYLPDMLSNDHYITAGSLHLSNNYQQIEIDEVTPGCIIQLYGGEGSNDSHNMVLMAFIERKELNENEPTEEWTFKAMGAEKDRVAVSIRRHIVYMDTSGDFYKVNKSLDHGKRTYIRLFKPKFKRDIV